MSIPSMQAGTRVFLISRALFGQQRPLADSAVRSSSRLAWRIVALRTFAPSLHRRNQPQTRNKMGEAAKASLFHF